MQVKCGKHDEIIERYGIFSIAQFSHGDIFKVFGFYIPVRKEIFHIINRKEVYIFFCGEFAEFRERVSYIFPCENMIDRTASLEMEYNAFLIGDGIFIII